MTQALPTKPNRWPYIVLFVGVLAVSSASIFTRRAQAEGTSSFVIAAWRLVVATLLLTPVIIARHREELKRLTRREIGLSALAGLMLAIHFATWISSLEYTSVITSTVLVTTHPFWVALAAPIFLREKLSRTTLIAVLLGFAGVMVITFAPQLESVITGAQLPPEAATGTAINQGSPLLGALLALAGAVSVATYYMIGRRVRSTVATIPYIWLTYGSAAIVMSMVVLVTRQPVFGLPDPAYVWLMLIALIPQLIGHSSFNYALGFMPAVFVALTVLFEPIGSTILAVLFLNETPRLIPLLGGVVILVALFVASTDESRKA